MFFCRLKCILGVVKMDIIGTGGSLLSVILLILKYSELVFHGTRRKHRPNPSELGFYENPEAASLEFVVR